MVTTDYVELHWALTGVAGVLTIGRFVIRGYTSRRLYWDDLAHLLAFLALVVHGALSQATIDGWKAIRHAAKGIPPPSEAELLNMYAKQTRETAVKNCFLHLVFWLVKIAFLLFYYRIFSTSRIFRKAWWAVLAFTLVTFWVPIGGVIATCGSARTVAEYKACSNGANRARDARLWYSCAMNVVTDLAIMALPLWMLRILNITKYQKLGLALIFSLAGFCVFFDIARTIRALADQQAIYTISEVNLAVVVSCLPTYRALFNISRQRSLYRPSKLTTWTTVENGPSRGSKKESGNASKTGGIHVTNGYIVSNEERSSQSVGPPGATSRDLILPPEPVHSQSTKSMVLPPYCSPV